MVSVVSLNLTEVGVGQKTGRTSDQGQVLLLLIHGQPQNHRAQHPSLLFSPFSLESQ